MIGIKNLSLVWKISSIKYSPVLVSHCDSRILKINCVFHREADDWTCLGETETFSKKQYLRMYSSISIR